MPLQSEVDCARDYVDLQRLRLSDKLKVIMTLMTVKAILEKLPPDRFKRIHRSYIIPLARIRSVLNKKVQLSTAELPVSDSYAHVIRSWVRQ